MPASGPYSVQYATRGAQHALSDIRSVAVAAGLFLFALAPRALSGRFLTVDEGYHWLGRVASFLAALRQGDFAGTNLIGHPGVTTLWLGTMGALAHERLAAWGWVAADDADAHLALLRLPLAVAAALCVALAYSPLRRLLGARVALLAALLWAGEPFLVAHGQLLHLDSLLASFMTLSLLALLVATDERPPAPPRLSWPWLVASGAAGGLALLTKSPSVFLLPMTGLTLLARFWRAHRSPRRPIAALLRATLPPLLAWCGVAALTWVALWPAAWVDPAGAAARVLLQAQADGGSPHGWGNFFWGRAVADPGPLFYPVAVALRLAPWTLVGLLALAGTALASLWAARSQKELSPLVNRRLSFTALMLALFALLFAVAMSIPPKKFDRYALPIFPALDMLAACGFARLARLIVGGAGEPGRAGWLGAIARGGRRRLVAALAWAAVVVTLGATLARHHPYELAYFNPLLGGGAAAARAIPVGWGEGYDLAGAYIAAQPNGADRPAAALYEPALAPYAPAGAAPMDWALEPGRVDYAVLYIDQIQRAYKPQLIAPLLGAMRPIHTVTINGIEYAYVYQIPPPVANPLVADFGDAIRLRGYDIDATAVRSSGFMTVTLEWEGLGRPAADYTMFIHVLDAAGEKIGQADAPPGGERWPTSAWGAGRFVSSVQRVPVRADAPPGEYWVALGIYDPRDFARLPLRGPPGDPPPGGGADALVVARITLP